MHMRSITLENAEAENITIGDEMNDESKDKETWTEGLSRILSGICANFSKAVCSSTMAHLITSNDGTRFQFSHGFSNFLVSQAIDVLGGKSTAVCMRHNYSKMVQEKVVWEDSIFNDYIHQPDALEHLCYYNFVANNEKVCKTFRQMGGKKDTNNAASGEEYQVPT